MSTEPTTGTPDDDGTPEEWLQYRLDQLTAQYAQLKLEHDRHAARANEAVRMADRLRRELHHLYYNVTIGALRDAGATVAIDWPEGD